MKDVKDFDDVRWDDGKPTVTDYVWGRDNQTASLIRAYKDEIERLREALRYYAANHYPNVDDGPWGQGSNDFGDVARAALGEKK